MNRDGSGVRQLSDAQDVDDGSYWDTPAWSPDGQQIAYQSVFGGNAQIAVASLDGAAPSRVTDNPQDDARPLWLPDGQRIVFTARQGAQSVIYVAALDGGDLHALTPADVFSDSPALWN